MKSFFLTLLAYLSMVGTAYATTKTANALALTSDESQYLESKEKLKVCIDPNWMPYEAIDVSGSHTGISADYMNLISSKINKPIELNPTTTWKATLKSAQNRECDLIALIRPKESRKAYLNFTNSYLSFPYVIATTKEKAFIDNIGDHLDKTYAVVEGYAINDYLRETYSNIKILPVKNFDDGIKKIRTGEAHGYLDSVITLGHYISEKGLLDIKVGGETFFRSSLSIASRNDEPLLNSIMQKALNDISETQKKEIQNRWFSLSYIGGNTTKTKQITFDEKEIDYINRTPVTHMCVDPDWRPYEAISGEDHIGIGGDILRLIALRAGIKFQLVKSQNWSHSLELFENKDCDILSMLNWTVEREKYMNLTQPYYRGHVVLVAKNEHPFIADMSELAGKKVVVAKGYSIAEFLERDYETINLIEVENYDVAFDMVASGKADVVADYLISAGDRIQNSGLFGLKIVGKTPYTNELAVGVQKDNPILLSIIQKSITTLEPHEITAIVNKWRTVRYEQAIDYTLIWQISGVAFIIIAITVFWNRRLSAANNQTQKALTELAAAQEELHQLATTDKLTGLNNRAMIDEKLNSELHRIERYGGDFSLILLDLDHFKSVNDTYGHQAGDHVLIKVSKVLSQKIRKTDIVGRWGGEEFIILCPNSNASDTVKMADKLRQEIENIPFKDIGTRTASFGISDYHQNDTAESIISRADAALYAAKHKGRNCVELFNASYE